jgi:adenylate kinase
MGKSAPAPPRSRPNILITGTPGTGKSSLAERVAAAAGFTQYDVSAVAKQEKLCAEYDEELDTYVIDEDKAGRRGAHSVPVRVRGFKV